MGGSSGAANSCSPPTRPSPDVTQHHPASPGHHPAVTRPSPGHQPAIILFSPGKSPAITTCHPEVTQKSPEHQLTATYPATVHPMAMHGAATRTAPPEQPSSPGRSCSTRHLPGLETDQTVTRSHPLRKTHPANGKHSVEANSHTASPAVTCSLPALTRTRTRTWPKLINPRLSPHPAALTRHHPALTRHHITLWPITGIDPTPKLPPYDLTVT